MFYNSKICWSKYKKYFTVIVFIYFMILTVRNIVFLSILLYYTKKSLAFLLFDFRNHKNCTAPSRNTRVVK